MHFAISATWGPTDPTRSALPFIFAASALQAGDTVNVPSQNSFGYAFKNNPGLVVTLLASVVTITALIVRGR